MKLTRRELQEMIRESVVGGMWNTLKELPILKKNGKWRVYKISDWEIMKKLKVTKFNERTYNLYLGQYDFVVVATNGPLGYITAVTSDLKDRADWVDKNDNPLRDQSIIDQLDEVLGVIKESKKMTKKQLQNMIRQQAKKAIKVLEDRYAR